jgi:hypothetical protein
VLVDPDVLRAFADQVNIAANAIRSGDVGHRAATAADGLDGSTTQWAARLVGEHLGSLVKDIARNVDDMGTAVRGAGDKYEVTDSDLSTTFSGIF